MPCSTPALLRSCGVSGRKAILLAPWAILFLGLLLTYVLRDMVLESSQRALRLEFDFRVNEIVANIERRLNHYEQVLAGAAGLFGASRSVEREEFAAPEETRKYTRNRADWKLSAWGDPGRARINHSPNTTLAR